VCGIVCAFDLKEKSEDLRPQILEMAKCLRHRGPDWSGIYSDEKAILAHERLAIVDPASGKQPLLSEDGSLVLAANGEIYNHRKLRKQFEGRYQFRTESDCEVILALYQEKGPAFLDEMNGIFAFAIYDTRNDSYFIALEYIHGKDLRVIFNRGRSRNERVPVAMACYAVMKLCEGLDYAHNKRDSFGQFLNLVHRDVSPQNIIVSYDG